MSKQKASKLDPFAEQIEQWFTLEKITLEQAAGRLHDAGCDVSLSRLSDWWSTRNQSRMEEKLLEQIATGARQCKEVEKQLAENPAPEFDTIIALHRVLIMKMSTQANLDPTLIKMLNQMMLPVLDYFKVQEKRRDLALNERRVVLLEQRASQAKAELQKLRDPKADMTDTERNAVLDKVDEILGLK